jgi:hypothetical protein
MPEDSVPVRFNVLVTKSGKTVVYTCLGERIESMAITDQDINTLIAKSASGSGIVVDAHLYQGPVFEELAPDLQQSFQIHLHHDLGINDDILAFIGMYSDYREEVLYVDFLAQLKAMLQ